MIEVEEGRVCDLSHDGVGIVKKDDKTYFVDGALPDEQIAFIPQKRRKGKHIARLEEVLAPSAHRVDPRCRYFGVCGGCAMQHLEISGQIAHKEEVLVRNLDRIGKVEPERLLPPLTGEPWHYRRKARLGVKHVEKKGGIIVGFRERQSSFITPLDWCETLDIRISCLLSELRSLVERLSVCRRMPQIEVSAGDADLALVFRHLDPLSDGDRDRIVEFAAAHDVLTYVQPGGPQSLAPLYPPSPPELSYSLDAYGIRLQFGPLDFIQVNASVNRSLVELAVNCLEPREGERVLDLFCGIGNFTLPIATSGAEVLGVEADEALVARGRDNAHRNGLANARFLKMDLYTGDVQDVLKEGKADRILIDPPRSGADNVVRNLLPGSECERLVYVSCNPATLARDAGVMVNGHGYRLKCAGVIDMFPGTAHVESIAVFDRS